MDPLELKVKCQGNRRQEMAQARPSYSTLGAPSRSLNPEQRTGHEVYTVLYDVYRGNTVIAGLIRGRCTTNTQRVAETIFVAEDSPFVDTAPHLKNTPLQINTSIIFPAAQFGGEPYLPLSALELEAGCIAQWLARAPQEDELIVKGLDKFESRPRNSAWYRLASGPMRVDRATPQLQQEEPLGCGQGSFPPPPDVLYRESRQWMEVEKSVGDSATVSDYCCEG